MEDFLFVADGVRYEEFDWRDPYVFWNEEEGCYYMPVSYTHLQRQMESLAAPMSARGEAAIM